MKLTIDHEQEHEHDYELSIDRASPFPFLRTVRATNKLMKTIAIILAAVLVPLVASAVTPVSPTPDLVIQKTTQTSSDFWTVKVKNVGNGDSAATTLKMIATPGGSYSCPVAAIKAGGTADVPCKMPFKSKADMKCEFILNPDKKITETSYANNHKVSTTNPKFN